MQLMNFHRLRGSVKVLSAVLGASVVVTMGAVTVAHQDNEAGMAQQAQMSGRRQQLPAHRRRRHPKRHSPPRRSPPPHARNGRPCRAQADCLPKLHTAWTTKQ
jgi:hypothetical protein